MYQLGWIAIVLLVALRMATGWHFFMEGSKKFHSGDFSSAGFLRNAKGPLADNFRNMVYDLYGTERLNKEKIATRAYGYRDRAAAYYGEDLRSKFVDQEKKYLKRIDYYFEDKAEDIDEYFNELAVFERKRADKSYRGVAHYEDRLSEKDKELYGKLNAWTKDIAAYEADYIDDLNRIGRQATEYSGGVSQVNPNQGKIDVAVAWILTISGLLLMVGLFTRLAALAVAGFLIQVILAQWPLAYGADTTYTYYQAVEVIALLLIAAIGAGKFAGLDFILWNSIARCCGRGASQTGSNS